jgi:hypothetical protein
MGALHRLHQSSLHYDNRYPTSADAFDAPQGNPTTHLFPLLPLGHGALPFYRTGWLDCFSISLYSPLISHGNRRKKQTAPSTAKGKRKCDDTNSTYEHNQNPQTTTAQSQYLSVVGSGFFYIPSESLFLFFPLSYLLSRGMEDSGGNRAKAYSEGKKERKKEREKLPRVARGREIHTHGNV